jgi:glycosyltransferase involved in cell wall biosynthesis
LRSLLAQTYSDFEAIIVDDASNDASVKLVERIAADDARIRIFRQAHTGVAGALNHGLRESRGELVAFLDHDDLWHPDKLARQVACLDKDESVGFVGCYSALIDTEGRNLGWRFGTAASGKIYRSMLFRDVIAGGSVPLVRKTAFEQAGLFDHSVEIQGRSDWDQWIRIARSCKYAMVEEILVGYTRRSSNFSRNYQQMLEAGSAVIHKNAPSDLMLDRKSLARALARDSFGIFCIAFADGEIASSGRILRRSLALSWSPVLLSPRRLLVVALFLAAKILPHAQFYKFWRFTAPVVFGLTPGEAFLPISRSGQSGQNSA